MIKHMDKYIVDTNIFFNMAAGINLGKKTEEVVKNITRASKILKNTGKGEVFSPPRVVEEFLSFFEDKEQVFIKEYLASLTIKSPEIDKISIPAAVFYRLLEDIRTRSYRGLNIGEEEINIAGKTMAGAGEMSKKDFEIKIGAVVRAFRDRYRQATRAGFLDSLADLDLILLAKETNGLLVSTDEGVVRWGRAFGVKEMPAPVFGTKMVSLLHHQE